MMLDALKALISRRNNRWLPDPAAPKINTRAGRGATGPGYYRTTARNSAGRGQSRGETPTIPTPYAKPYRTTAVLRPLTRARARARMCVDGVCLSGSIVVDGVKCLIHKGNSHYFAPYFAPTSSPECGRVSFKPLKSLEKGGF